MNNGSTTSAWRMAAAVLILTAALSVSAHAQDACAASDGPGIIVYGLPASAPLRFPLADLRQFPQTQVSGRQHDGTAAVFEGVRLIDVLARVGAPRDSQFRGAANQMLVRVEAADGYAAVIALAEADTSFRANVPILALTRDGVPLDSLQGPVQMVVPDDRRHGRWVRQVRCLRLSSAKESSSSR
jgi:hypothetical protein